jgi:hypothetical protein
MSNTTTYNAMPAQPINQEIIQSLVLNGDVSKMNAQQRVEFYKNICESLGLNPLTQPFQILRLQGKETLYATKSATEQLRKIHGVSVTSLKTERFDDVFLVTANVQDKDNRTDAATGAVSIVNLKGEALANALMKAETKAKRRATLSICGLGMLDESEVDSIPGAQTVEASYTEVKPMAVVAMITEEQKEQINLLITRDCITEDERAKVLQSLDKLSEERAEAMLKKMGVTVLEREMQAQPEAVEVNEQQA